jgi:hypothetical protein
MGKTWKDKDKWSKKQEDRNTTKKQKMDIHPDHTHKTPKIRKFEWYWSDDEA